MESNAIGGGATKVQLKIADNPNLVMQIQANGPVLLNQIGMNAALVGPFAAGSLQTGDSIVALGASTIAATAPMPTRATSPTRRSSSIRTNMPSPFPTRSARPDGRVT